MKIALAGILLTFILTPTIFQIVFTVRRIKEKSGLSILMIFFWTLGLVIVTSFCAVMISLMVIDAHNDAEEPTDINGIQFFALFGILTAFITAPFISIVGGFLQYLKNKNRKGFTKRSGTLRQS